MFAILVVEREPSKLENLPAMLQIWLLSAGGLALLGILLWAINALVQRRQRYAVPAAYRPAYLSWLAFIVVAAGVLTILPSLLHGLWQKSGWVHPDARWNDLARYQVPDWVMYLLLFLAGAAVTTAVVPVIRDLMRIRARRIWALARLSFKEAIRRRILYAAFGVILVVFLFVNWFLQSKPEYQVQSYVRVMFWAMAPVLIVTSGLLASFSIPADLKNQTMHTIVTKPVERFEIVLGRSLGYIGLMTIALGVMTAFSLIFVARNVEPEAKEESYKARVPVFGQMEIREGRGTQDRQTAGISVGREWDYRKYISGGATTERAVWSFVDYPADLANRDTVRCEFAFDIFRTTKGALENKGIFCTFVAINSAWDPQNLNAYHTERDQILAQPNPALVDQARKEDWPQDKLTAALLSPLAKKYGYYELLSKEVIDYHTLSFELPGGVFDESKDIVAKNQGHRLLQINVRCESPTQYLGMAKHDLYLLDNEKLFELNYFKGALGLWFRLCIVVVMAVTLSTYLSGIISFITVMFFYILGLFTEFIQKLAEGKLEGGGPMEAFLRLSQGANLITPLDQTPGVRIAQWSDIAFRGFLRGVLSIIPDVDRYDLTTYVSSGFDISGGVLMWDNILPLLGYLIPCTVLGYYLMKSREIAA